MNRTIPHKITNCTICPHTDEVCHIGYQLARKLCQSISAGGDLSSEDFEITGHVDMPGCTRPCTGAFHATKSVCHMFGDVEKGADIGGLMDLNAPAAVVTLEATGARLM